jgi:hypothetical protein
MKTTQTEKFDNQQSGRVCSAENRDCGYSNRMCPGVILGGVMLAGWGLYALGAWVWRLITG